MKIIAIILALAVPSYSASSLTFGAAGTDRVNCGSATGIDGATSLTVTAWIYQTTQDNTGQVIVSKYRGATAEGWSFHMNTSPADELSFDWERVTTDMLYDTTDANITTNKWWFVAIAMDQSVPSVALYVGDQTTPAVAKDTTGSADGSGGFNTDAGRSLFIGNRDAATPNAPFKGQIGTTSFYYNKVLTQAQIQEIQFSNVPLFSPAGLWNVGYNDIGTQYDLTGNGNNGTVTGATASYNGPPCFAIQGAI